MVNPRAACWLMLGVLTLAPTVLAGPWQPWGPNGGDTNIVAAHPRIPGEALTARIDGSNYVDRRVQTFGSHDFGTSWPDHGRFDVIQHDQPPISLGLGGTPEYRYLAAAGRLYRSQDGGIAWTPLGYERFGGDGTIVGVNPDDGAEIVFALGGNLYHSTDAATSATPIATPGPAVAGAVDWSTRRVHLVLQDAPRFVVAKSLDTGTVWAAGPPDAQGVAANLGHAAVATTGGLQHSSDGGLGWQPATGAGASFVAAAIAYAPHAPVIAYAVERMGTGRVLRSVDGGASWVVGGTLPAPTDRASIAVQADNADVLLVGTTLGIYRSVNAGSTWSPLPRSGGLPDGSTRAVVFDATNPALRLLWRDDFIAQAFADRTKDGGTTWTSGDFNGRVFASDPTSSGHVFTIGTVPPLQQPRSAVFRSVDGAATFAPAVQNTVLDGAPIAMLKGDVAGELHFFGTAHPGTLTYVNWLMRSTDGGATWTDTASPPTLVLSAAASATGALYAGTDTPAGLSGLYRSIDNGTSWSAVLMGDFSGAVTAVAVAPSSANRIYAALESDAGRNMATSGDGGATWTSAWTAMPTSSIEAIAVDPAIASTVYVASHGQGVFRSVDAGATWTALDDGLADRRVRGLAFDPLDATKLYATTESGPFVANLASGVPAGNRRAIEYYHQAFDHYFVSADADEIAGLDAGVFEGWARTGESFAVAEAGQPAQSPVCRFFGVGFAPKSSHFYTPYPGECEIVKTDPKWVYEKIAFGLRLPGPNSGCASGTTPLYRMWNRNGGSEGTPNHRYTTSLVTFFQMYSNWLFEGEASTFVFACVPQ